MKKLVIMLCLVSALLFVFVVPVSAVGNQAFINYQIGTGNVQYNLGLGNNYDKVGTVGVWSDATNLYIQYDTLTGWYMTDTHLGAASGSTLAIAQAKIPDQPGQMDKTPFPAGYWGGSATYSSPYVTTYTYTIPLSYFTDLTDGWVVISAHAVIGGTTSGTAWANGSGTPYQPLPELPAVVLLGLGLTGIAAFIVIKKNRVTSTFR